jgi:hypothetical protein
MRKVRHLYIEVIFTHFFLRGKIKRKVIVIGNFVHLQKKLKQFQVFAYRLLECLKMKHLKYLNNIELKHFDRKLETELN